MTKTPANGKPAKRLDWRRLLRFDLSMLLCFIFALNLAVFANWKLGRAYKEVRRTAENRALIRSHFEVGWPWPFLRLNGIQKRLTTHSPADAEPHVEWLSFAAAAKTIAVNALLVGVVTLLLLRLKVALFAEVPRPARAQRTSRKISTEFV